MLEIQKVILGSPLCKVNLYQPTFHFKVKQKKKKKKSKLKNVSKCTIVLSFDSSALHGFRMDAAQFYPLNRKLNTNSSKRPYKASELK